MSAEYIPPQNPEHSKFQSAKDEALYLMGLDGVIADSAGEVSSPGGWFARISIPLTEVRDVADMYLEELQVIGVDAVDLVGNHLIRETPSGVRRQSYLTPEALDADFAAVYWAYCDWKRSQFDDDSDDDPF